MPILEPPEEDEIALSPHDEALTADVALHGCRRQSAHQPSDGGELDEWILAMAREPAML